MGVAPSGRGGKLERATLPDFAIGRFPVTMREYAEFLDSLDEEQRTRRLPRLTDGSSWLIRNTDGWSLAAECVDAQARAYVPLGRELDLPVHGVSWFDASAYAEWQSARNSQRCRLPTALEWEKAMRGADGRAFSMGHHFDPSFAKTVRSRPVTSQPEPVGAFPLDESPYGVRDLAGGIADWTSTMADGGAAPPMACEAAPNVVERQVRYMGGHWGRLTTAVGAEYVLGPQHRNAGVGFRIATGHAENAASDLHVAPMRRR